MDKALVVILCPIFLIILLSSCNSTITSADDRLAICNQLKSKMIFKGNTSNTRNAEIENSEMALLQRQYERYHCDQIY